MLANSFELYYYYAHSNWWFVGKWMILKALLQRVLPQIPNPTILDIGCGTGEVLQRLTKVGTALGVDISREALGYCYLRGCNHLVQADTNELPFAEESFDVLVILDLFEHLPDDIAAAQRFSKLLRPGGYMLVTAPSMPCLWSKRDVLLHHYRRYQVSEMRTMLTMAGLEVERIFYRNFVLFPVVWLKYTWEKVTGRTPRIQYDLIVTSKVMNWLLIKALWLETKVLAKFDLPAGSSVVCLARRVR